MHKGKILQQFENFKIYKNFYGKPANRDWEARVVFLIQILLIFGNHYSSYMAENLQVTYTNS